MTERSHTTADVVVVGGGPAGCAAAITARRAGARVVLVERDVVPRDRPGETLAPGIEPLLEWLGAGDVLAGATLARHDGHWVESFGERHFAAFGRDASGPWRGFQVWRRTFDHDLRRRAADLGVDVRPGAVASSVIARRASVPASVGGIVLRDGTRLTARVVIDASGGGGRHWLARALGLGVARLSPRFVATYGYAAPGARRGLAAPLFRFAPDGWTWIAPIGERGWAWTRLSVTGRKVDAPPALLRGLRPTCAVRGADVTWRVARTVAGPGWLIAGDAGAVLDPAASHGVLRAIMSGARAGLAACHPEPLTCHPERSEGSAASVAFTDFDAWFRAGVLRDAEGLRRIYATSMRDRERRAG